MATCESKFKEDLNNLPIRLYYQDEARFGRINKIQKCWYLKGKTSYVMKQQVREYTYLYSTVCPENGDLFSLILPNVNTENMNIFLKTFSESHQNERIIICMDKACWHTTQKLDFPKNILPIFLPPYSPELNPAELIWRELRIKEFNNNTFTSMEELENKLEVSINNFSKNKAAIIELTKFSISYK